MAKSSPQTNYFMKALTLNKYYEKLLIIAMVLSLIFIYIGENKLLILLSILSIVGFIALEHVISNYQAKAETIRRKDFIDNAFGTKLLNENSEGYYDNEEIEKGLYKALLNLFENSLFSKEISEKMLEQKLKKSIIPALILMISAVYGFLGNQLMIPILQLFLSKEFLCKNIKLNNYNKKVENIYNNIATLCDTAKLNSKNILKYEPHILNIWIEYEANISNSKLFLDGKIYNELNPSLTKKWEKIKTDYKFN
ncbi:MAG: hypothetical protein Q7K47_01180 [Fusobacterium sp. JB019]|nr:hypothetical protein [Fusobacterium sp. JB019]